MPYAVHPELEEPSDDTVIWRYLSFPNFIELLELKTLWCARADTFDDPLEGTHTDAEIEALRSQPTLQTPSGPISPGLSFAKSVRDMRATMYINCWRSGAGESMAMWDIYGRHGNVVAIKSTISLLKASLSTYPNNVYITKVKYVDWNKINWHNNLISMYSRKDESYAHESEVRALIWGLGAETGAPLISYMPGKHDLIPLGLSIPVDPQKLITEIRIGPREQARLQDLVLHIMKRYDMHQPVILSDRLKARS